MEDLLDAPAEELRDPKRERRGRIVLAALEGVDGFTRDVERLWPIMAGVLSLLTGLLVVAVLLLLAVVLPILSFMRASQARRIASELGQRLERLESQLIRSSGEARPVPPPAPAAAEVSPPGPAALHVPRPEPPPPPTLPPLAIREPSAQSDSEDLEQRIGSRWLLYAGIAAVVLGMSYFVKFAFDNGWISEPLRVVAGVLAGVGLLGAGTAFWSRGLRLFGQALAGGGIVVLYVSIYAALHFYQLIARAPAFGLMVVVTAVAAWLADRQRSQPLAALALVGGFATPLLVGGERGAQVVLFTYMAILIAGAAVLARRHAWPLLSAASYACTFLLVVSWFFSSYEAHHWLRTELFLTLYAGLFGYLLWALLSSSDRSPQALLAAAALATAPLAYHLASIVLLTEHAAAWLVYLILVTVAGLIVSQRLRSAWLRILVLLLVGVPALVWLEDLRYPGWYAAALGTAVVLYGLHVVAQWEAVDDSAGGELPVMEMAHAQLNGLLLPLSLYLFLETRMAVWNPWMVAALSLWNGGLALAARSRAPHMSLQLVALSATLAAAAIVLAFDGPAVAVGWAAEGVLLGWLAVGERSRWLAAGSGVLIALGSIQLGSHLAAPLPIGEMAVFNPRALAALIVIGLLGWLAWRTRNDAADTVRLEARTAVIILANVLAVLLLSAEIHAFFDQRALDARADGLPLGVADASLAEQLTLSVTWALYAVVLIAIGIRRQYAPARYFAILLFGLTIAKVLLHDIAGLDRFYRMLTVLGVGVLLLVASYLYQRRSAENRRDPSA
jgi:uncharacterized membrane protein